MMVLAVCVMAMAQMKLTPQAQLQVVKQKSKVERKAAKARARGEVYVPTVKEQRMTLVVKVAQEGAAETFAQMKANLQGRRVKQPVRGLYIQNGYKIVIK